MFSEKGEEEIIEMAQTGNNFAIEYLIDQNMDIVYAKAKFFFIKGLDREDVVQEGRVGLYKAIRDFRREKGASFRGFSQLCVHRQLISAIKKANRQKHVPLNSSASLDKTLDYGNENGRNFNEILPDKGENLERKFICQEILTLIMHDLEKELTDLEWDVFMSYLESKSYQEISEELDVSVKTVDNALQRARKKIDDLKENYNLRDLVG
ncbi:MULTISPECIES: RNA polymerase sporulation sigma factor SigH [unclassified Halanaerobium]|uniref:RNA polymerase sporulation sigma factor SigH n=1 Tax=unclassified Halanaerobium TaxID=2641197 RepID=UPI000DF25992|nr:MULTISPECIES: RNA polymerase sporulation sigma factor SigH [unclassified Halanaerobium]RCW43816.1 RNA polymerase sporulation-specific sigma factor [Halanaerobium sp. MA284_MarDTE_T2]RCW80517.1 RNA polymerase sporulation-specific sigma factor [Halanaerobium sp. DL-01]